MKKFRIKHVIALIVILSAIGYLGYTSMTDSFRYYVTVSELMVDLPKFGRSELKVAGLVKEGSIKAQSDLSHTFQVTENGAEVLVHFSGLLPDTFKDGAEVVVTGRMVDGGRIEASNVLAKCGSRYEAEVQS